MAVGNVSSTKHHQQIVKMMVVVLGFFAVLAGPWHVADLILDLGGEGGRPMSPHIQLITREVVSLLMSVNGWAMPIIYASFNSGVKKHIGNMLTCGPDRCVGLCGWKRVEPANAAEDGHSVGAAHPASANLQMSTEPVRETM